MECSDIQFEHLGERARILMMPKRMIFRLVPDFSFVLYYILYFLGYPTSRCLLFSFFSYPALMNRSSKNKLAWFFCKLFFSLPVRFKGTRRIHFRISKDLLSDYATVEFCSWGPVTASFLKHQEPFRRFEQCIGGQFSATLLSEFQYLIPLTNFLTL